MSKTPEHLWAAFEPHEQGGAPRVYASAMKTKGVKYTRADLAEARLKQAVEVIEFYANPDNWIDTPSWDGDPECFTPKAVPVINQGDGGTPCDCGDTVRQFIKEQADADK